MSVFQTVVRGVKQIPAMFNAATHEDDPEFVPQYSEIPSIPYRGEITPGGPTEDMDFGGGQGDMTGGQVKHHVSNRPNFLGKVLAAAPGIIGAGIAGAARPNVAGGGAADVFRAAEAGGASIQHREDRQRNIARQADQDAFRHKVQQSQIDENDATAEQRRAKANAPIAPLKAQAIGSFGWYDRVGQWHPAPEKTDPKAETAAEARNFRIANAGGFELPEKKTFDVPTGSPVPGQGTMQSTVSNVPPPEGYNNLPGTSGDERVVMPSAELKGELRHPDKPTPVRYITAADGSVTAVRMDADGNPVETPLEAKGKPQRAPAGKKSLQQVTAERTAVADQQNLQGDQRTMFIANGRLPAGKASKTPFDPVETAKRIAAAMNGGGGVPPPAQLPQKPSPVQLPPEISAALPVGRNTRIKAPDGSVQMWVKNPDGTVKRLR